MKNQKNDQRMIWLIVGVMAGLSLSYFWPHEPVHAGSSDRNNKFTILTCPTGGNHEAVFVLDFLTGRLVGANFDRTGKGFAWNWMHNVAADFKIDPESTPNYAITSGIADLPQRGSAQWGSSVIYIAEMSTGMVGAYAFPFKEAQRKMPLASLVRVDSFQFREAELSE